MPLWLTKVGNAMKVLGSWLKGNWMLLVLGLGLAMSVFFLRGKASGYDQLLKEFLAQQVQNKQQLEDLRKIQQEQILKQRGIDKKYQEVILKIEHDYQDQIKTLTRAKEQELHQIIERNHDDPDAMSAEINGLFGIPIFAPPSS